MGETSGANIRSSTRWSDRLLRGTGMQRWGRAALARRLARLGRGRVAVTFPDGDASSIEPLLATSWERQADSVTWVVHLRDSVRFHNGEPFNADAVTFSIGLVNQRNAEGKSLGGATVAVPSAEITEVQAEGRARQKADAFLRGADLPPGTIRGS